MGFPNFWYVQNSLLKFEYHTLMCFSFQLKQFYIILTSDFDDDGMIKANDIRELVNRITGITGRHKLKESDADRNQLSEGEMEKVIKHVSRIKVYGSHIINQVKKNSSTSQNLNDFSYFFFRF